MVYDVASAVSVPVIGGGGVACLDDVLELLMAGASAVQIGTAIFVEPGIPTRLVDELEAWMLGNDIEDLSAIIGVARGGVGRAPDDRAEQGDRSSEGMHGVE
jgi:dihydroorotate dehydrogenase (NAD+) catalytic subunit